ncbi:hypothetical protein XI08_39925 [Bradyrhizobium sp. CCBAU 11361]|nr:hypothetical protein [Bradyrhizobium sp. CCBAU 11361]
MVARAGVGPWAFVDGQAVVNVMPIFWGSIGGVDPERLHSFDQLQHALDLGPAGKSQKTFSARADPWHSRVWLPWCDRAQNVDAR